MTWINIVKYEDAKGKLLKLYERVKGPDNNVDNIMLAHSLRPHTMEGHMSLYKTVLHHPRNSIDTWFLEAIGTYTSILNVCAYCIEHHFTGMQRLLKDSARADAIRAALETSDYSKSFNPQQASALHYVHKLTLNPAQVSEADIQLLRESGWDDGEILEINQVSAYFNYANRTVLGLGINSVGDVLGLSPSESDNVNQWGHA